MPTTFAQIRTRPTTFLIAVGAVSAGVHAGLAPEHLNEWPLLGAAFLAAAVALATAVTALSFRPSSTALVRVLGALLAAVASAYAVTRFTAVPPLDPSREPFDALGVCTSSLEVFGFLVAARLGRRGRRLSFAVTTGGTA
jgi:hypothetical protein